MSEILFIDKIGTSRWFTKELMFDIISLLRNLYLKIEFFI